VKHQLRFTVAREGSLIREQFIERDPNRPYIRARICALPLVQLWRHIGARADHHVRLRQGHIRQPGDAKVHDFDRTVFSDHDVRRLDVAVHDVVPVREGERLADAHDVSKLHGQRKDAAIFDELVEAPPPR